MRRRSAGALDFVAWRAVGRLAVLGFDERVLVLALDFGAAFRAVPFLAADRLAFVPPVVRPPDFREAAFFAGFRVDLAADRALAAPRDALDLVRFATSALLSIS
jgi:hypothetical protein